MNDKQIKIECLKLANGNLSEAKDLYLWVEPAKTEEDPEEDGE